MRHLRLLAPLSLLTAIACGRSSFEDEPVEMLRGGAGGGTAQTAGKSGASASAGTAGKTTGGAAGASGKGTSGLGGTAGQGGAGSAGKSGAGSGGAGAAGAGGMIDPCLSLDCDDGIACTKDLCANGACVHTPFDALCNDGLACDGVEICDPGVGCVSPGKSCDDGISCTEDSCAEPSGKCSSTPNDKLCPVSHACDATEGGCSALAYAHSQNQLFEVRLPTGKVKTIGPFGAGNVTDIALTADGTLYALTFTTLLKVDTKTGKTSPVVGVKGVMDAVGMDAGPDGLLYVAAANAVLRLDPAVGAVTKVASFPPGMTASGDLAFLEGRLLGTANTGGAGSIDVLVEFDLATGSAFELGSTGFDCIWGLAAYGSLLYGLTCNGQVISVDPMTGASTTLSVANEAFWGASAR